MARVKLAEYLINIVNLRVFLLVHDHAVEELHVGAPPRDRFQAVLSVANLREEAKTLVSLGLRLPRFVQDVVLREGGLGVAHGLRVVEE